MVSRASFRRRSRRSAFVLLDEATPPPPNLEPARFYRVEKVSGESDTDNQGMRSLDNPYYVKQDCLSSLSYELKAWRRNTVCLRASQGVKSHGGMSKTFPG